MIAEATEIGDVRLLLFIEAGETRDERAGLRGQARLIGYQSFEPRVVNGLEFALRQRELLGEELRRFARALRLLFDLRRDVLAARLAATFCAVAGSGPLKERLNPLVMSSRLLLTSICTSFFAIRSTSVSSGVPRPRSTA